MAIKFNPLTGNFDFTGSGGGASYIDGEVATYADLPLNGSAALNSAWLVRTASGVWPVTRKQAGIYIRTATGGSNRDADYTYAGTMPDVFSDANFTLYGDTDSTKNVKFDVDAQVGSGQTRIITVPNTNVTLPDQGTSTTDKPAFAGLVVGNQVGEYVDDDSHKTQIVASGTSQTPLALIGGSGTFEFWKDAAASRVIAVGFATPGSSAGNNLVFSSYATGVPWAPVLEVPTGAAMDVKTGGIQFADSTTNSKKVLLSAANVSASTTRTLSAPDASGVIALTGQLTDTKVFTASGTWTKPSGAKMVHYLLVGGGGGGGGGRRSNSTTAAYGGGGGAGGGVSVGWLNADFLGATESVTIGAGGSGGSARTASDTNGTDGTVGNATSFTAYLEARGGVQGSGGSTTAGTRGGSTAARGAFYGGTQDSSAGGGAGSPETTGGTGENRMSMPSGGGGGAGKSAAGAYGTGGASAAIGLSGTGSRTGISATANAAGTAGTGFSYYGLGGSGGSPNSTTGAANKGGDGGSYGGGGGGGSGSLNAAGGDNSGGAGANGVAIITTYF